MNITQRIELVNSSLTPKNMGFLSREEINMVRNILELKNIDTEKKLRALRDSVVKFYRPILDNIREMEQKKGTDLGFMKVNDKFSGIIGVIDGQFAWNGWMC